MFYFVFGEAYILHPLCMRIFKSLYGRLNVLERLLSGMFRNHAVTFRWTYRQNAPISK